MKHGQTDIVLKISLALILCLFRPSAAGTVKEDGLAEILMIRGRNAPKIDGKMDEAVWRDAIPIGPLQMVEPDEGGTPTEQTEVRIVATQEALYFGFVCYDRSPDRITSFTMQRDAQLRGEDHIKIVLDTFSNGRTGYIFAVNPNGARYDALIDKAGEGENEKWDGIWEADAHRWEEGWSVEIYLPIKTIRFRVGLDQWGFNVERRIQRNQETNRWSSPSRNYKVTHVSQSGKLLGVPDFQQGLGLTVRPYVQVPARSGRPEELRR